MGEVGVTKLALIFLGVIILPIWILPIWIEILPISLKWKILFTIAGAIGLYLKFGLGLDLKGYSGRKRR